MIDAVHVPSGSGVITKSDVLAALGDTDPHATNAGKLQRLIGRGSTSTVQKFLDEIRAALVAIPTPPGTVPTAPGEAVAAIWSAAWAAAQVQTLGRLEAVTNQRDTLQALSSTQAADIKALAAEVDELGNALAQAKTLADAATQALENLQNTSHDELVQVKSNAAATIAQRDAEIVRITSAAETAAAIAQRDAQITAAAMQSTIDRLTDQVAELKSWIHRPPVDTPTEPLPPVSL